MLVAVPAAAESVNVLVPEPGDAIVVGAKVAVTPLGVPVTDNAMPDLNPFSTRVVTVIRTAPDAARLVLVGLTVSVKVGVKIVRLSC